MKVYYCKSEKRMLTRAEMAIKDHDYCGQCGRQDSESPSKASYLLWRFYKLPMPTACPTGEKS